MVGQGHDVDTNLTLWQVAEKEGSLQRRQHMGAQRTQSAITNDLAMEAHKPVSTPAINNDQNVKNSPSNPDTLKKQRGT